MDAGHANLADGVNVTNMNNKFEIVSEKTLSEYNLAAEDIILPTRSTKGSAGYDVYSPFDIEIPGHMTQLFPLGIKAHMIHGLFLQIVPRSSVGIKKHLMLSNTVGIIDEDYYNNPDNEGMMFCSLYNYKDENVKIKKGERIAQAIFLPFAITDDDSVEDERTGGIGSTGI